MSSEIVATKLTAMALLSSTGRPCAVRAEPRSFSATMPKPPGMSSRSALEASENSSPNTVSQRNGARKNRPSASGTVRSTAARKTAAARSAASWWEARTTSGRWTFANDVGRKKRPSAQATATLYSPSSRAPLMEPVSHWSSR